MGWKKIWARLAPKVISLSTSMEGTSPYTTEKSEAISSGDKDTLRNIQDKEGSLARKAAVAQLGLAVAPQILPVIANPATASTTAGAIAATGLDAAGLVGGLSQLNNYWNNRKNLTWNDTPGIILSGLSLVPGSSQLTNPRNWAVTVNTIKNINPAFRYRTLLERVKTNPELAPYYDDAASAKIKFTLKNDGNYNPDTHTVELPIFGNNRTIAHEMGHAGLRGGELDIPNYDYDGTGLNKPNESAADWFAGNLNERYYGKDAVMQARQNAVDNFDIIRHSLADGTLRFGEPTTYNGVHQSSKSIQQFEFPYQRWDVINHGADPNGAFFTLNGPANGGFLAKRPYTSYWEIKSQKPLIQIGEIRGPGNTKNNIRNAIVDYARKNGADAVEFRGIADNNLQNQNILFATDKSGIRFKYESPVTEEISIVPQEGFMSTKQVVPVSRPISEAERLGIPKSMRSNPKALEDPYYWGYQQWNNRYNGAIESENWDEVQRLRDLHFKIKAPNAPQYNFYHGTFNKERPFYIFEPQSNNELFFHFSPYKDTAEKFMGIAKTRNENGRLITAKLNIQHPTMVTDSGWWNWYRIPEANPRISKMLRMDGPTAGQYYSNLLLKEPSVSEANGKMMDMLGNDAFMYKNYTEDTGRISVAIPRPSQIKLADPITRTDTGEIIPIVKRDNFRNPDIRYKQGGIIKAQNGKVIGWNPSQVLFPKRMFELVAKRSNGAQTKSIPTIIRDVVTGRDKSFYNEDNINGSNEIDTYLYGVPYNSEFTGDVSVGPDYTNYINKNYPNRNIKTYNAHFGDTLYIDDKAKPLVEKQLNNGEVVGGSMGRYAHAPSYIVTKEEGRPYDAGGHLIKFGKDNNGNIVANMSDIYDFLPEDFEEKYNQTENPSWTRRFANNIGTPFIVRQNNIPVRFKEIVPEYKTDLQRELGDFLSQWGNTYDLKLPLSLSDEQIQEIFNGRDYGDDILDFMASKGYIKPVYKSGGIVKGQNGFLNTWQKAYNSKFGKSLRNFLNGTDSDLSDEEYLEKHGYNKPVGSIGILGALVAPEWEGLDAIPVAENFGRVGIAKGVPKTAQMRPTKIKNFEGVPQVSKVEPVKELTKFEKFLQRPIKEQDDIVRFWNGEKFSNMEMLKLDKKAYQQFKNWINK